MLYTNIGQGCADAPFLPDIHRRSVYRKSLRDEPVIDDALLKEGWYSIGKHNLYVSQTAPEAGFCSAYYPIYLKGNFTS